MKKLTYSLFVIALCMISLAAADELVFTTEQTYLGGTAGCSNEYWHEAAQSFTPDTDMMVTGMKWYLDYQYDSCIMGAPGDFIGRIRTDLEGTDIITTAPTPYTYFTCPGYTYINFTAPVLLEQGTKYYLLFTAASYSCNNEYRQFVGSGTDPYPGGELWSREGGWGPWGTPCSGDCDVNVGLLFNPPCTPSWQCSGYSDVCEMFKAYCDEVTDINQCGESYTGNYSEFPQGTCGTTSESTGAAHQRVITPQTTTSSQNQGTAFSITGGEKFNLFAWLDQVILSIKERLGLIKE